jgi:hypothetical protein
MSETPSKEVFHFWFSETIDQLKTDRVRSLGERAGWRFPDGEECCCAIPF